MNVSKFQLRVIRKCAVLIAIAPLFQQIGWCTTGFNRTLANTVNGAPSTYSNTLQSIALLPLQALLNGGNFFGNFFSVGG
jgi:hypothetical protein